MICFSVKCNSEGADILNLQYQTVMNKKQSISILQTGTPRGPNKSSRTLSQTSASATSKTKLTTSKINNNGKENFSSNIQAADDRVKTNQNINPLKGLKRIKQKAQGQAKVVTEKQPPKVIQKSKLLSKQIEKTTQSHNSSSKSLLGNKIIKPQMNHQSDKKSPLTSQKSTPKNLQKKASLSRIENKKLKSQLNESQQIEVQSCINTPKTEKEETLRGSETVITLVQKPKEKKLMISMFQIRRKLTEGAFSTTFEVIHIETGLIYCLKVFEKLKIKQQGLQQQVVSQLEFRRRVKSQHIQKIYAVFDDEVYIYFVEEYVTGFGLLEKQLHNKRKLTQKESGNIFKQVFDIVRCIHSQNYIHRDIRLQNLVKCFGVIKLIDFSWIACLRFKKERDTFCGTYKYAPPELLEGENYDESIDIWSLGILLYELTTGQSPFNSGFMKRNSHSMNFPIFLSNELVDLIGRLLSEKGVRMRIEEILMHEWTNKWEIDGFVSKEIWDFWVL